MAVIEKNTGSDDRVIRLAQPQFFVGTAVFPPFVFARLPAGEGQTHATVFNTEKNTLFCSCSFRPQPCLHVRSLRQLYLNSEGLGFSPADALPDWVQQLVSGQGGRVQAPPADPGIARQQRRNERLERAADGFDDLETWLLDTIRRGLATTVSEDPKWAENIAARMADASLTGLSRTLRLLGSIPSGQADWAEKLLAGLGDIYLALRAFRRRDHLPETLLADLQNWIGMPAKKEEILAQGERTQDKWLVMGQLETSVEDKLKVRRTWLQANQSRRYALLLDYAFGGFPFTPGFTTGSLQQGTMVWYSSAWPLRALVQDDFQPLPDDSEYFGYADFQAFAEAYATALGQQPWLAVFPAALLEVRVFFKNEKLYALDRRGKTLPLLARENQIWLLLALAGGAPVTIFGEWDGAALWPFTVLSGERVVEING